MLDAMDYVILELGGGSGEGGSGVGVQIRFALFCETLLHKYSNYILNLTQ